MSDTWFAGRHAGRDEYIDKLQARIEELQAYETIVQYVEAENAKLKSEIVRLRSIAPPMLKTLELGCDQWEEGWNYAVEEIIEKMGESE